jgi:hypothetical protein
VGQAPHGAMDQIMRVVVVDVIQTHRQILRLVVLGAVEMEITLQLQQPQAELTLAAAVEAAITLLDHLADRVLSSFVI